MKLVSLLASALIAASITFAGSASAADPENTMIIELSGGGEVVIALRPDLAPKHVERIKRLVREGAYDNVVFHRVIDGFMAQTGDVQFGNTTKGYDPARVGTGGSDLGTLPAEFSKEPFERGVVGMARAMDPNSATSQFFIMFASAPHLNGQYTVVGQVEQGMENVDKIKRGSGPNGTVSDPDRMVRVRIAADEQ
jgi:Peptidyl-prolyl cis-trans isomerase (rotamase) - cyclophilin family